MAPPKYSNLLNKANDVLLRGMHYGWWRLLCSTKSNKDIQFITTGESNLDRDVIACFKYRKFLPQWNMIFSQRFWSNKDITAQISVIDSLPGFFFKIGGTYNWDEETFKSHLNLAYENDFLNFNAFTAIKDKLPPINASLVMGKDEFVAGVQSLIDCDEQKLPVSNFCVGYEDDRFAIHGFYNMGSMEEGQSELKQLALSLWNNYNDYVDMAALIRHRLDSDESKVEFGVKIKVDDGCNLRVKIDSESQLGIGMTQLLIPGITMFLATRVNLKAFADGGHKLGIGMELVG